MWLSGPKRCLKPLCRTSITSPSQIGNILVKRMCFLYKCSFEKILSCSCNKVASQVHPL